MEDRYAGMKVRVVSLNESQLAAYIVHPPDDSARAALIREGTAPDAVAASLQCFAQVWTPGLRKWRGIRNVGRSRWSLQDLSKEIRFGASGCNEDVSKSVYDTDLELMLEQPNQLKIQNVRIAEAVQIWERTSG